eukprot:CAMPEP_0170195836 /NCGR_PEP_ID=MMETSP0040_2-20121228/62371_1 /TAXON_ID=641309 /ORGANISM="Lotharella oceanica, Strain CCMP622" /LENGTH=73 /DNA_ID=CAMNT_0010445107 /DNA_START=308 /DNA_END=525 /DNA_ORIENTATION=+
MSRCAPPLLSALSLFRTILSLFLSDGFVVAVVAVAESSRGVSRISLMPASGNGATMSSSSSKSPPLALALALA